MTLESNTGLGVNNHYGPRTTGKSAGQIKTAGRQYEISVDIDSEVIANGGPMLEALEIPAGSVVDAAYAIVTEVFALGGTSPTILLGTDTSEVTNGLVVSEAQAEAAATYDLTSTLTGTWGSVLAADTTVGVALGGTSPTVGSGGKMKVVVRYTKVA